MGAGDADCGGAYLRAEPSIRIVTTEGKEVREHDAPEIIFFAKARADETLRAFRVDIERHQIPTFWSQSDMFFAHFAVAAR